MLAGPLLSLGCNRISTRSTQGREWRGSQPQRARSQLRQNAESGLTGAFSAASCLGRRVSLAAGRLVGASLRPVLL